MPAIAAILLAAASLAGCSAITFDLDEMNTPVLDTYQRGFGGLHPAWIQYDTVSDNETQGWHCSSQVIKVTSDGRDVPDDQKAWLDSNMPVCVTSRTDSSFVFSWSGSVRYWAFLDLLAANQTEWTTQDETSDTRVPQRNTGTSPDKLSHWRSQDGTFYGNHQDTISLVSGKLAVAGSRVDMQMYTDAQNSNFLKRIKLPLVVGGVFSSSYQTTGQWDVNGTVALGHPGSSISISVPPNTTYWIVNGTSVETHVMRFQTTIEPDLQTRYFKDSKVPPCSGPGSPWPVTMVSTVLEPWKSYIITLTVPSDAGGPLALGEMVFISQFNTTYDSQNPDNPFTFPASATSTSGGPIEPFASPGNPESGGRHKACVCGFLGLLPFVALLL